MSVMLCHFYTVNFHLISDAAARRGNLGHCLPDLFIFFLLCLKWLGGTGAQLRSHAHTHH